MLLATYHFITSPSLMEIPGGPQAMTHRRTTHMVEEHIEAIRHTILKELRLLEAYGAKPEYLLSILHGVSRDPAVDQLLLAKYLEVYPSLARWIEEQQPQ